MSPAPTFLVVGAGKAGTTTLHSMLAEVPDVFMSTPKEIQYFSHPVNPDYPLEWYYSFFDDGADATHRGESSPTYSMFPTIRDVPERIHAMNPDIKLVYLVREPVSRMVSAYAQTRRMGFEFRPISEALLAELTYTTTSCYALQLSEYLRFFSPEQIHVEDIADLTSDPLGVLQRISRFLGLRDEPTTFTSRHHNPTNGLAVRRAYGPVLSALRPRGWHQNRVQLRVQRSWVGSTRLDDSALRLDPGIARDLHRLFHDDTRRLEEMLGRSFSHWGLDT